MTPDEPLHYPNQYEHCDLPGCTYYACVECSEDWPCSNARASIEQPAAGEPATHRPNCPCVSCGADKLADKERVNERYAAERAVIDAAREYKKAHDALYDGAVSHRFDLRARAYDASDALLDAVRALDGA